MSTPRKVRKHKHWTIQAGSTIVEKNLKVYLMYNDCQHILKV